MSAVMVASGRRGRGETRDGRVENAATDSGRDEISIEEPRHGQSGCFDLVDCRVSEGENRRVPYRGWEAGMQGGWPSSRATRTRWRRRESTEQSDGSPPILLSDALVSLLH